MQSAEIHVYMNPSNANAPFSRIILCIKKNNFFHFSDQKEYRTLLPEGQGTSALAEAEGRKFFFDARYACSLIDDAFMMVFEIGGARILTQVKQH
jgi:hypothetical protein